MNDVQFGWCQMMCHCNLNETYAAASTGVGKKLKGTRKKKNNFSGTLTIFSVFISAVHAQCTQPDKWRITLFWWKMRVNNDFILAQSVFHNTFYDIGYKARLRAQLMAFVCFTTNSQQTGDKGIELKKKK